MMYVLLYALCRGRCLYDVTVGIIKRRGVLVTVTCRMGIMIMMMLVVYCLFVCLFVFSCAICLYFRLWVCNMVIGTVPADGWVQRAGDWAVW